jgi:hypothetical protein
MLTAQICGAGGPRHRFCTEKMESALHITSEPPKPRDEFRSIDHQPSTSGRWQRVRKYLGQRLTFEIDIRASVTHRRIEAGVTEPLADRGEYLCERNYLISSSLPRDSHSAPHI